ncbi:hypothetical protein K4749_38770 [Streptomyces sp. TRM72054]|uniref:hypothetical protein n=1 Tax=Streptomyces sp. TRM72054 TaxID=2870562 RepID=UPI001C8C58A2|nr:hypothetical protein [Streptomyces sp. TRM72054]MBX9399341.1 hypothetical protein [Streptomyces sp. TRM72054]
MALLPYTNVFACLAHWVETCCPDERLCLHTGICAEAPADSCLSLSSLWASMRCEKPASAKRAEQWQAIAQQLHYEAEHGQKGPWTLIALWLLTPRLRRAVRTSVDRTGAEASDVCSEVLAGALQAMATVRAASPDGIEDHLVGAAYAAGRKTGRRAPNEVPEAEIENGLSISVPHMAAPLFIDGQVVRVGPMSMELAQRAHGERLGALAQRLGLLPHVREVRRLRRAGLAQGRSLGQHGIGQHQPGLFEMGGDV